jgi:O-antigen/teichoic acid export membrane protein
MVTTIGVTEAGQETPSVHFLHGRLLARNVVWNLIGGGAPMLVAVFCIPILAKGLGTDRFGVLALAWALIGYTSLFDLGLGRALTQLVARKLGAREDHEVPALVWTSLVLMLLMGLIGVVVAVAVSPWLVHRVLNIPSSLQRETLNSFYLVGLSIPVVISTAALRGYLEAKQRFDLINAVRVPMGAFTFVGPLLVLPFSRSLLPVVAVLTAGRLIAWAAHFLLCIRVTPELGQRIAWRSEAASPLLRLGGWMTVSNVVGPIMVTFDRFLIGAVVSISAVAYYATPYEVVTKLWIVPGALVGVMFPAFSTSSIQDRNRMAFLFGRSVKYLLLILFPVVLIIVVLAQDGLKLWLGTEFAQNSMHVLRWLAVGVLFNSVAHLPAALVQGVGKPELTAKLHLIELPLYMGVLWWLTKTRGIEGAAIAWTARAAFDALFLFIIAKRFLPARVPFTFKTILLPVLASVTLALATVPQGLMLKGIFLLLTLSLFFFVAWFAVLSPEERNSAQGYL